MEVCTHCGQEIRAPETLGQYIKQRRTMLGIKKPAFAKALDISEVTVDRIELSNQATTTARLAQITKLLKLDPGLVLELAANQ